jgi:hypothetical protein
MDASRALSLGGATLALVVAATATEFTWEFALFAIPLVLLGAALVAAYRVFRNPYERR